MKLMGHADAVEHLGPRVVSKAFGIKSTNKAFEILSSKLYKDKIRAVIREVSCNAYDSHVAAGKADEPFTIFLPSNFDPYFKVRDYGIGLSAEEVETIFATFFESTKEDSNDFIGALGLGSKSPFSYVDSFTVITYDGGKRIVFECFKDEGIPQVVQRSEMASNEPVGVEIIIPVKPEDIYAFTSKTKDVCRWFNPQPLIENAQSFTHVEQEAFPASGWMPQPSPYHSYGNGKILAIMGQVEYQIDTAIVGETELKSVIIHVPLGDLDVQAGREELSYDKATIANIQKRLAEIKADIREKYTQQFKKCRNLFAAQTLYNELQFKEPLFKSLEPTYRGHVLSGNPVKTLLQKYGTVDDFHNRIRYDPAVLKKPKPLLKDFVIFLECRKDKKDKARLHKWHRENPEKFGYSITLKGAADDPAMLNDLKGLNIVSSADISLPRQIAKLRSVYGHREPRQAWEHEVSSEDEVSYILTRALEWSHPNDGDLVLSREEASSFFMLLKGEGFLTEKASYIPWSRKNVISKHWINLYDSLKERHAELTKNEAFVTKIREGMAWRDLHDLVNHQWFEKLKHIDELPKSDLTEVINRIRQCRTSFTEMNHWVVYEDVVSTNRKPRYDLFKEWTMAKNKYPLFFRMIQPDNFRHSNGAVSDEIVFREMAVYINAKVLEETV